MGEKPGYYFRRASFFKQFFAILVGCLGLVSGVWPQLQAVVSRCAAGVVPGKSAEPLDLSYGVVADVKIITLFDPGLDFLIGRVFCL